MDLSALIKGFYFDGQLGLLGYMTINFFLFGVASNVFCVFFSKNRKIRTRYLFFSLLIAIIGVLSTPYFSAINNTSPKGSSGTDWLTISLSIYSLTLTVIAALAIVFMMDLRAQVDKAATKSDESRDSIQQSSDLIRSKIDEFESNLKSKNEELHSLSQEIKHELNETVESNKKEIETFQQESTDKINETFCDFQKFSAKSEKEIKEFNQQINSKIEKFEGDSIAKINEIERDSISKFKIASQKERGGTLIAFLDFQLFKITNQFKQFTQNRESALLVQQTPVDLAQTHRHSVILGLLRDVILSKDDPPLFERNLNNVLKSLEDKGRGLGDKIYEVFWASANSTVYNRYFFQDLHDFFQDILSELKGNYSDDGFNKENLKRELNLVVLGLKGVLMEKFPVRGFSKN